MDIATPEMSSEVSLQGPAVPTRRIARVYLSTAGHIIVPSPSNPLIGESGHPPHLTTDAEERC